MSSITRAFHISEMTSEQGFVEIYNRRDKRVFRQQKNFGNWHVTFANSEIGLGHWDKYNALGSLDDTYKHLSLWISEKLGTSEQTGRNIVEGAAALALLAILNRAAK